MANFEQVIIISHFANFEQFKKLSSHFVNFEQVISHFADFEQAIIKIVILLTLNMNFIYLFIYFFCNIMMKSPTSNNNINAIKETKKLNKVRSNLSREETKTIRKKLCKKETASYFFKEKEQEGSLTNIQKNILKN